MNQSYLEFDPAGNVTGTGTLEDRVFAVAPRLRSASIRIEIEPFAVMKCGGEGHRLYYVVGPRSSRARLSESKPIAYEVKPGSAGQLHEIHRKVKADLKLPKSTVLAGRPVRIGHTASRPVKLIIDSLSQAGSVLERTPPKGDLVTFSSPGSYEITIFDEYYYAEPTVVEVVGPNDVRATD